MSFPGLIDGFETQHNLEECPGRDRARVGRDHLGLDNAIGTAAAMSRALGEPSGDIAATLLNAAAARGEQPR